jgi:hypothetical protein
VVVGATDTLTCVQPTLPARLSATTKARTIARHLVSALLSLGHLRFSERSQFGRPWGECGLGQCELRTHRPMVDHALYDSWCERSPGHTRASAEARGIHLALVCAEMGGVTVAAHLHGKRWSGEGLTTEVARETTRSSPIGSGEHHRCRESTLEFLRPLLRR